MNRLQKKCLIASVITHGSLLAVLFIGPAFFSREDNVKQSQILTMISSRVVDDAPSSDASSTPHPSQLAPAPAPAPQPVPAVVPTPEPPVQPRPEPQRVVAPKPPEIPPQEKTGTEFKRVNPTPTTPTKEFTPVSSPPTRPTPKVKPTDTSAADDENRRMIATQLQNRLKALTTALASDHSAQIGPTGDRGEAVSNYRDIVYSMYTAAWQPPSSITDDAATVTVRVTIARNGQVTSHEILKSSGNAAMDKSIENTLDTVTVLEPFPAGSKDLERSYSIKFDISAKRSLE